MNDIIREPVSNRCRFKKGTEDFINKYSFSYFITLNFKEDVKEHQALRILKNFHKNLNIKVFGKDSKKALRILFALESGKSGHLHVHALCEDPKPRMGNQKKAERLNLKEEIKFLWRNTRGQTSPVEITNYADDEWFKEVDFQKGVSDYITKEMMKGNTDVILWELFPGEGRRI